jgi:tetratricopeptide (TPR) repeat protein
MIRSPARCALALACALLAAGTLGAEDFEEQLKAASAAVEPRLDGLEQRLMDGEFTAANEQLLAVFPKETRTPAQCMLLGNMLYGMDAKLSYALHHEAATKLPDEPDVLLEWAMEQHRAGEFEGALAAYDAFSRSSPDYAPVHGLAADCLVRLGRAKDAAERWRLSERARSGSLENFETLVCEIYKDPTLIQRRADLVAKARKGDVDAATRLIALDGKYERDWWNDGPERGYLKRDLALLDTLPADPRLRPARCVIDLLLPEEAKAEETRATLLRHGYLLDAARTVPEDPALLSLMLGTAISSGALGEDEARQELGGKLLSAAKDSRDAALWNAVAFLYSGKPASGDIEKRGWEATGDARFAAGYLAYLAGKDALAPADPIMAKALAQFPEDSRVVSLAMGATPRPDEADLVRAIKAEYRHFSPSGLVARASAKPLRRYFQQLGEIAK